MRLNEQEKRCPYLNTEKVKTCGAISEGLKVPNRKELFEYCEGRFHLCQIYKKACKSTGKLKERR